jgi:chromate transporter
MTSADPSLAAASRTARGSWREVPGAFLKLGLTSFGGPIAHLGYFREEFVVRRKWLDESAYADLVALCQFLPGPASSQVGFALGLMRGGALGAVAAWIAFTLPSAIALVIFALGAARAGGAVWNGLLHGLKVVAVAVVAQAVWGMARTLCPDKHRATIAVVAAAIVLLIPIAWAQVAAIALGGLAGLVLCRDSSAAQSGRLAPPVSRGIGIAALALFFALLLLLPIATLAARLQALALFDAFYRAGALVFGGGHVVLPLLQAEVVGPGWVTDEAFLAGYGAAQAVPGPLFAFAAYLGAVSGPAPNGWAGAALCLVAVFLPGLLLVIGALPFWEAFRRRPRAQAALRGTNAAVVGLLGAALYQPVWTTTIRAPEDLALALAAFVLLMAWKAPPWLVVILTALGGIALAVT